MSNNAEKKFDKIQLLFKILKNSQKNRKRCGLPQFDLKKKKRAHNNLKNS